MKVFNDPCGTARALDTIGDRWALLVVRELLYGPKRFVDLARGLAPISQNVLSQRLHKLTDAGVVRRRTLGPPVGGPAYQLTEMGEELHSVLVVLGRWGSRLPLDPGVTADLSVDALTLALETTFDPGIAGTLATSVLLRLGHDSFLATVTAGEFTIRRSESADAEIMIITEPGDLQRLVFARTDLAQAVRDGTVMITGDRRKARRFLRCFPVPPPFPDALRPGGADR
ncbi:winged helix-turn-helix transcriptional regulator [Microlunatus parietis]|uniref:DNA-binding HxlR family transcriptional regulator n=1 Tax=Microlunatus parietis TaxID=682979 RepID=A0A7Y9I9V6_9ACTN|nr:helix-turn-helix domain-containing protein [Microlunatus parietis]NYE72817.1 DNA-binding HxlR family transcriptional regulator [Microlunatus parietis]